MMLDARHKRMVIRAVLKKSWIISVLRLQRRAIRIAQGSEQFAVTI
jgi:hypothetical protein